jgi:hypothetical protein
VYFGLRDIIIVLTSASKTGIVPICTVLSNLMFLNNDKHLHLSPCLVFKFMIICE